MPVRLDKIPPLATRPGAPRFWVWLGLLVLFLFSGVGLVLVLGDQTLAQQSAKFWRRGLGVPLVIWGALLLVRLLVFVLLQGVADGWDEQRQAQWTRALRRGRRSQQILATSLYTALCDEDDGGRQIEALLANREALKTQPVRRSEEAVHRHSRLPDSLAPEAAHDEERHLLCLYRRVLTDLAKPLSALPASQPLAVLVETECALSEELQARAWTQAWGDVDIQQEAVAIEGDGLFAIDQWLDTRIDDQALLLVVAVRLASAEQEGSAESAVGLLLGNRLTQRTLSPLAYLHRPEQERAATSADLLYAARQALGWVPLAVESLGHLWLSGLAPSRQAHVTEVLQALPCQVTPGVGLHDLGTSLGHPGCASPWAAIAAATEVARTYGKSQFIFSGAAAADSKLWCTAVTGASPPAK